MCMFIYYFVYFVYIFYIYYVYVCDYLHVHMTVSLLKCFDPVVSFIFLTRRYSSLIYPSHKLHLISFFESRFFLVRFFESRIAYSNFVFALRVVQSAGREIPLLEFKFPLEI
jgi:hypothetical protein